MYIRRKVFSYGYDENGEQKLFSTTEIMNEESYLEKIYSEKGEAEQRDFSKFKGSRKLAEKVISEGKYSPHIFGKTPSNAAIKSFRHSNSPLSMRNGSYAEDAMLDKRGILNLKISTKNPRQLRKQAGGKVSGTDPLALTKDKRAGYGGNYTS